LPARAGQGKIAVPWEQWYNKKVLRLPRIRGKAYTFRPNPLLMLVVFSIVFSFVMRVQVEKHAMFLFVALLPWN